MALLTLFLADETATVALGQNLGRAISDAPEAVTLFLEGDLGAGKTTLTRGVLRAFGHSGAVKSPTYTLVEAYETPARRLYHFDLYRLGDPEELEYLGIRDYFAPGSVCLLEWPARGAGYLPEPDLVLTLSVQGRGREAQLRAGTRLGQALLEVLAKSY